VCPSILIDTRVEDKRQSRHECADVAYRQDRRFRRSAIAPSFAESGDEHTCLDHFWRSISATSSPLHRTDRQNPASMRRLVAQPFLDIRPD
jgi:hypothetical protein